ncbi:hypothetical protein Taro_028017 [Colocasia esculenta]|uniref:Chromatin assembly factor 1 subunit FAS1 n=1 Tax=Colocasia esculenta TaxID=4460 RepID=A0A843VA69_COLES|nr:hypothetical protein [Colocasia esculenta]
MEAPSLPGSGSEGVIVAHTPPADVLKQSNGNGEGPEKATKKPVKRKRVSIGTNVSPKEKAALINALDDELRDLFKYFNGVLARKLGQEEGECTINSAMACMLEGSTLPFSMLADEIYDKLKAREGIALASVQRDLHFIGCRLNYGVDSGNPNLLEDQSESSLWCWEVRDLKLLPKNKRKFSVVQRKGREKVLERVVALVEMLSVLRMPETEENYQMHFLKASEKLGKTLRLEEISSMFEKLSRKSADEIAEKENKSKEKELLKEMERNMKIVEKEKRKHDRQLQKEKFQSEKELKRRQIEADKEERRREKEEAELKKQQKRQQEELERELKRREREEAEARKQLSIHKQASIMQRFLKSKKCSNTEEQADISSKDALSSDSSRSRVTESSIALSMDLALTQQDCIIDDLWKSQVTAWSKLRHSKKFQHWGVRHKPKGVVFNELKLQGSSCKPESLGNLKASKRTSICIKENDKSDPNCLSDNIEESPANNQSSEVNDGITFTSIRMSRRSTKLLQFDKTYRPAYYVGPRRPFAKDYGLDYNVDSDEEWEEEEPGESLSDCDKDDEEEILEEDPKADDDDESEDGFFVPDGYLSENEGVQDDSLRSDAMSGESRADPSVRPEIENEECSALLQRQKHLDHLTQQALRKNQPLIITNLLHEKSEIALAKDLNGALKVEQICLQTLCVVACSGGSIIEHPFDNRSSGDSDVCQSEVGSAPTVTAPTLCDPNLQEYVRCIQSNPHGMGKVLESLQQKFPSLPKSQLRNKVKDISEFVNNRWQVKKEVLKKLGMSTSPDKGRQHKGISSFFSSKRCLPPTTEIIDLSESSPESRLKEPTTLVDQDTRHDPQENLKIHTT